MATTVSRQIKATDPGCIVTGYAGTPILKGTLLIFDPSDGSNRVHDGGIAALSGSGLFNGMSFVGVAKDEYPINRPGKTGTVRADVSPVEIYTSGVFEFNLFELDENEEWQVVAVKDNDTVQNYVIGSSATGGGIPCGVLVERLSATSGLVMISPSRFFQYQDLIV